MAEKTKQAIAVVDGKPIPVEVGLQISAVAKNVSPCGGKGRCGKCKVYASGTLSEVTETEHTYLTKAEISAGIRLACKTKILGDCIIKTLDTEQIEVVLDGAEEAFELSPTFSRYGVAVDIGTTTIAIKLYDNNGKCLSSVGGENPQNVFGADVISRVEHALKGNSDELRRLIINALDEHIISACLKAGIDSKLVDGVVITGNTVMLSLLTGESVEPFSHAPFKAENLYGYNVSAESLGLSSLQKNTLVYLPRCVSAFVGADIVCAMLAVDFDQKVDTVIADIGTNGEIALISNGEILVCSTSAGPAFEGVGISSGMSGERGAVDKVSIVNGKLFAHVIGEGTARGICGSGIVDAVACLLDLEELDESGYLENEVELASGVSINQSDVRSVQLAKSAINAGIKTLLSKSGIKMPKAFCIAGGFGSFLNVKNAERIGLIPQGFSNIAKVVGNASLTGASRLLLDIKAKERSEKLSKSAKTVDLAKDAVFVEEYTMGMIF
ncbi:MAG: DUF4445 domain-containing protein [Clostridiales bacterium]|nr:DUF4445 domain-containing protein [Clostridiales bacterium]